MHWLIRTIIHNVSLMLSNHLLELQVLSANETFNIMLLSNVAKSLRSYGLYLLIYMYVVCCFSHKQCNFTGYTN